MRIIAWNCNMSFRKKNAAILKYNPDILIISECENEKKLQLGHMTPMPLDFYWHGDNENKGIGIFAYSNFKLRLFKNYNPQYRYVIPIKVKGETDFNLYAIWAMDNKEHPSKRYIAQVWLAINYYKAHLKKKSVLMGDFNSNKIWDNERPIRISNHSKVHNYLQTKNIHSLYHHLTKEEIGKETLPTLFMYRNESKSYHIDYCFASNDLLSKGYNFSIGKYNDWIQFSDHVPIIADFN